MSQTSEKSRNRSIVELIRPICVAQGRQATAGLAERLPLTGARNHHVRTARDHVEFEDEPASPQNAARHDAAGPAGPVIHQFGTARGKPEQPALPRRQLAQTSQDTPGERANSDHGDGPGAQLEHYRQDRSVCEEDQATCFGGVLTQDDRSGGSVRR